MWVQEVRISGRISYKKVLGEKNPSDLLTKYMSAELSARHLQAINSKMIEGRAETAPEIDNIENENDDGDIEETLREEGSTIMSWTRRLTGIRTGYRFTTRFKYDQSQRLDDAGVVMAMTGKG